MQHNGDGSLKRVNICFRREREREREKKTRILWLIHFPVSLGAFRSNYSVGSLNLSQNERVVSLCVGCV